MNAPPDDMILAAVLTAMSSPCAKSRRGVVVYRDRHLDGSEVQTLAVGWNGPPGSIGCLDNADCRRDCGKRCVHAEQRAIRQIPLNDTLVRFAIVLHVKIDDAGKLMAGGGPSCWQCSREILDHEAKIHGVWLYQTGRSVTGRDGEADRWRYWEADEFHRETLAAAGIA